MKKIFHKIQQIKYYNNKNKLKINKNNQINIKTYNHNFKIKDKI